MPLRFARVPGIVGHTLDAAETARSSVLSHRSSTYERETVAISAVILTKDEALNLPRCLDSITDWCTDIHVVDSGSTDETLSIAADYGAKITHNDFVDHPSQWSWALTNLPLAHQWVLALDADHIVTPELRSEIRAALNQVPASVAGFYIPYHYRFRGKRIRGLKANWLQLIQADRARPDRSELLDSRFFIAGESVRLSSPLIEDNLRENSIAFWTEKHIRYGRRAAAEEVLRKAGILGWDIQPDLKGSPDQRVLWLKERWYSLPLGVRPLIHFVYRYAFRGGFRDGSTGLLFHALHSLWFRLLVDLMTMESKLDLAAGRVTLQELLTAVRGGRAASPRSDSAEVHG